jgi:hypothetical protein
MDSEVRVSGGTSWDIIGLELRSIEKRQIIE